MLDFYTIGGVLVTSAVLTLLAMTQYPYRWQNLTGFLVTVFLGIPGLILVVGLLQNPFLMTGALIAFGAYAVNK